MILSILDEIAAAKGKKKLAILESYKDNIALQEVWHMAYSRMNFGTSVVMTLECDSNAARKYGQVIALLDKLRCRVVTGNAAKSLITDTLTGMHPDCIEVYNRIIKKNLKCGIGFTAGQKVYGSVLFKKYPVMLISAHCNKKAAKIVASGAVMQLKGDGVRGIAETTETDGVSYFSRQGEVFNSLERFNASILSLKRQIFDTDALDCTEESMDFDGEFCVIENGVHNPSKASGILNKCIEGTATKEDTDQLTYMVWDLIDHDLIDTDIYKERLATLKEAIEEVGCTDIILAETWEVNNLEEVHAKYAEIVKTGNEGVVLKSLKNLWKDSRVSDCIKYKEKHSTSLGIISYYYGESGKEFQNILGGFTVTSACGKVITNTGSGLSLEQRGAFSHGVDKKGKPLYERDSDGNYKPIQNLKEFLDNYLETIVEMEYNKRTKSKDALRDTYSLRFPIVKYFRCDKSVADTLEEMISEEVSSYGLKV